jgi:hypothetical protein
MEPFLEMIDILSMVLSYIYLEKVKAKVHRQNLEKSKDRNKIFSQMKSIQ